MYAVETKDITKYYGRTLALENVSIYVKKGEFVTILGPSGSGKTTLLNIISGFVEPTEGSVYINGQLVNDIPPFKRNIGMVFQSYALFPHMNVFENLAFGLRLRKMEKASIVRKIKKFLSWSDYRDTRIGT